MHLLNYCKQNYYYWIRSFYQFNEECLKMKSRMSGIVKTCRRIFKIIWKIQTSRFSFSISVILPTHSYPGIDKSDSPASHIFALISCYFCSIYEGICQFNSSLKNKANKFLTCKGFPKHHLHLLFLIFGVQIVPRI